MDQTPEDVRRQDLGVEEDITLYPANTPGTATWRDEAIPAVGAGVTAPPASWGATTLGAPIGAAPPAASGDADSLAGAAERPAWMDVDMTEVPPLTTASGTGADDDTDEAVVLVAEIEQT